MRRDYRPARIAPDTCLRHATVPAAAAAPAPPVASPRPLIVRLRNWVGDVTLSVPTLQRLHDAGYDLRLVGKRWAGDLLAGHGWPVHPLPGTLRERIAQLQRLRGEAMSIDFGFRQRPNGLLFPYSFSSALEMRLAGLRPVGQSHEGRGFLLTRSVPRPRDRHELLVMWQLGDLFLGQQSPPPRRIGLKLAPQHLAQARELRERHGLADGFVVICPFAGGTWAQQDKTWPDFPAFAAGELAATGRPVVVCPGPGEEPIAREHFAGSVVLEGVGLGAYAALLSQAALMVSNDTGPGHLAAAVGTPLVSVMGPSDPSLWRPWGEDVQIVQGPSGWPSRAEVSAAVASRLPAPG